MSLQRILVQGCMRKETLDRKTFSIKGCYQKNHAPYQKNQYTPSENDDQEST